MAEALWHRKGMRALQPLLNIAGRRALCAQHAAMFQHGTLYYTQSLSMFLMSASGIRYSRHAVSFYKPSFGKMVLDYLPCGCG